jgi:hypothetical protein
VWFSSGRMRDRVSKLELFLILLSGDLLGLLLEQRMGRVVLVLGLREKAEVDLSVRY